MGSSISRATAQLYASHGASSRARQSSWRHFAGHRPAHGTFVAQSAGRKIFWPDFRQTARRASLFDTLADRHGLVWIFGHMLLAFIHPLTPHVNVGLVWWAFLIGILSHLVMDSFTKEGVPWLLPIPFKLGFPPVKTWRITTGHFAELLIVFPGLIALDVWFCASHYHYLLTFVHQHLI